MTRETITTVTCNCCKVSVSKLGATGVSFRPEGWGEVPKPGAFDNWDLCTECAGRYETALAEARTTFFAGAGEP